MVWIRKDDAPGIMPWNLRYDPVVKQTRPGQGVLPPHYRPSTDDDVPPGRMCGNCAYYDDGLCTLYAAACDPEWYCDSWEAAEGVMVKHLAGQHDQSSHGRRGGFSGMASAGSVFAEVMAKPEESRGISVNIMGEQPKDGYMVAFQGAWQPVPEQEFNDNGRQVIRDYLRKHARSLGQSKKTYMGIWFNTGTRQYEFDLSEQIADRDRAIEVGRTREQEAAWDVAGNEPVFIGARDEARQSQIDDL